MNWFQNLVEYIRRGGAFEYRPPVPPKPRRLRDSRQVFFVVSADGRLVRLEDALAELGLVADGK